MPHLTRKIDGVLQPEARPENWPSLGLPDKELAAVRQGMWAVVNDAGGTAPVARIPGNLGVLAGKTGSSQVRRVSREAREHGFKSENLPWEFRPHALFVAYAPYDNPRYALSVVVEHGNAGAAGGRTRRARHHGRRADPRPGGHGRSRRRTAWPTRDAFDGGPRR